MRVHESLFAKLRMNFVLPARDFWITFDGNDGGRCAPAHIPLGLLGGRQDWASILKAADS
jgi:hypothetical protein